MFVTQCGWVRLPQVRGHLSEFQPFEDFAPCGVQLDVVPGRCTHGRDADANDAVVGAGGFPREGVRRQLNLVVEGPEMTLLLLSSPWTDDALDVAKDDQALGPFFADEPRIDGRLSAGLVQDDLIGTVDAATKRWGSTSSLKCTVGTSP